jgi:putative ABC transport system permease protein
VSGVFARIRTYWRGLVRPTELDADMASEMRFHIDMETERLERQGLEPTEARRQAALRFGGIEAHRGAARDALGFTPARGLSVDVKLGLRMLARSPGLTAVALFALTLAIGAGTAYLEFTRDMLHGHMPFPGGDRVVGIVNWDQQTGRPEHRAAYELTQWRGRLATLDEIGGYRLLNRNLITEDGRAEPVRGVAISVAAFRITGTPPLVGRVLDANDERPGAPPVVVLGHDVFSGRFGSDPSVVGRDVRLGADAYTVVGVMPPGFSFPGNHSLWVPLRMPESEQAPLAGGELRLFGRIAPDATLGQAQAEVTASALQLAEAHPGTHRHLRPQVKTFVASRWSAVEDATIQTIVLHATNLFFLGLLALCGANVATLVFARTATRDGEISIRTALGASRARIVGQLFVEALVLSLMAAAAGLAFAYYGLLWAKQVIAAGQRAPVWFWWHDSLSPEAILYALVLAVLAALMVGVVPALKATGPRVQDRLKHASGGSAAGLSFGGVWTAVIVMQAGVTVVFLSLVVTLAWGLFFNNAGDRQLTIPGDEFVVARVNVDRDVVPGAPDPDREQQHRRELRGLYERLAERLAAEPGVAGVGYGSRLPGMNHLSLPIELEGGEAAGADGGLLVRSASISPDLLPTLGARLTAGRAFTAADAAPGRHVAIVDRTFVRTVLGGGPAIGRRIRPVSATREAADGRSYALDRAAADDRGPWLEIVGVVEDLTADVHKHAGDAVVYRPVFADAAWPLYLAVRASGLAPVMWRLRVLATEVDPSLRLDELQTLADVKAADRVAIDFFLRLLAGIGAVALVLAAAGIYALMSFTVARRTTEIGIRLALGADPRRIVFATFARAMAQVGAGVALGSVPAAAIAAGLGPELNVSATPLTAGLICAVAAGTMLAVTALACVAPARRALGIQPVETLKAS